MAERKTNSHSSLGRIRKAISALETPKDLFNGMFLKSAFAPDNILFFRRTHTRAFRPDGVSNNFHHRYELVVVLRKSGTVRIGNYSHILEPGEAILIFPNQFHHYMDVEEGDLDWLFITFELGNDGVIKELRDCPRVLNSHALDRLEKIIRLHVDQEAGESECILEMSYQLSRVLKDMRELPEIAGERARIHSTDDTRDVILERINSLVRQNLDQQITIANLAKEMDYSVSYLRAIFRDRLGVSLGRYIRESRLSRAAEMLQNDALSVTEVAQKTGFESLFAFSRAFKNAYGVSPKAYSKLVNQNS